MIWLIPKYRLGKYPYDVEETKSSFDRNKRAKKKDLWAMVKEYQSYLWGGRGGLLYLSLETD